MDNFLVTRHPLKATAHSGERVELTGCGAPLVVMEKGRDPGDGTVPGSAVGIGLFVDGEFRPFDRYAKFYDRVLSRDNRRGEWEAVQARLELEGMPSNEPRRRRAYRIVVDVFADDTGTFGRGSLGIAFNEAVDFLLKRPSFRAVNVDATVAEIDDEGPYDADTGEAL